MEYINLSSADLVKNYHLGKGEEIWNEVSAHYGNKTKLNIHLLSFFKCPEGREILVKNGVEVCPFNKIIFKKEDGFKYFNSYGDFVRQNPYYVSDKRGLDVVWDDLAKEFFRSAPANVYDQNFQYISVSETHLKYKKDHGEAWKARISRNKSVYTLFPPNFYGNKQSPKDWLIPQGNTIGIEIEMLFPSIVSKLMFSHWLFVNFPGWYCEYDGSLQDHGNAGDNGLELISPPLLFDELVQKAPIICEKAKSLGATGFHAGPFYGMHVTNLVFSKRNLRREVILSRYVYMVNNPALRTFWQLFSRRKGESVDMYAPFKNITLETAALQAGDHKQAVYIRNDRLVETRIFRANLNARQVIANIEICYLLMSYCVDNTFDAENPKNFLDFLERNASDDLKKVLYKKVNTPIAALIEAATKYQINNEEYQD